MWRFRNDAMRWMTDKFHMFHCFSWRLMARGYQRPLGTLAEKKTGKRGIFSQVGDPPPVWECHVFEKKKNYGLFCIFFVGGSPMLKTVKNGNGIWVGPPPTPSFFKIPKKKKLGKASFAKIPLFYLSKHTSNTLKTPINNTLQTTFKIIYFFRSKSGRKNK